MASHTTSIGLQQHKCQSVVASFEALHCPSYSQSIRPSLIHAARRLTGCGCGHASCMSQWPCAECPFICNNSKRGAGAAIQTMWRILTSFYEINYFLIVYSSFLLKMPEVGQALWVAIASALSRGGTRTPEQLLLLWFRATCLDRNTKLWTSCLLFAHNTFLAAFCAATKFQISKVVFLVQVCL